MRGSLYLVGKLGSPGGLRRLNTIAAGQLIHMLDQISNRLLYLPRARSCMARGVSLFLAGESAW